MLLMRDEAGANSGLQTTGAKEQISAICATLLPSEAELPPDVGVSTTRGSFITTLAQFRNGNPAPSSIFQISPKSHPAKVPCCVICAVVLPVPPGLVAWPVVCVFQWLEVVFPKSIPIPINPFDVGEAVPTRVSKPVAYEFVMVAHTIFAGTKAPAAPI